MLAIAAADSQQWLGVEREWRSGDTVTVTIPMELRAVPVDRQHPDRAGILKRWRMLVAEGLSLIIFAEGTRSADGQYGTAAATFTTSWNYFGTGGGNSAGGC